MTLRELEKIYRALGGRKRLEILKLLSSGKEYTVGDIAKSIRLSFKSTSKHLIILRQVGFLERRQAGYVGLYSLDEHLTSILKGLLEQVRKAP